MGGTWDDSIFEDREYPNMITTSGTGYKDIDYGKPVKAEEKVKCPYCDKMVSDVRLDQHIRAKHPGKV